MKNNNYDNFIRKPIGERNRETNITIPFTEDPECNEILTKELLSVLSDVNAQLLSETNQKYAWLVFTDIQMYITIINNSF